MLIHPENGFPALEMERDVIVPERLGQISPPEFAIADLLNTHD
jgi:hypothetical protein